MNHASLFSGIGGPEIAAAMLGWDNVFHCEINDFGRKILEYWFPNSTSYEDIKTTDFKQWRGKVDVLTGGFPCQPFSYAGQRRGADDDRYLWPQMLRAIDEIRPAWVVGENVAGIVSMVEPGEVSHLASQGTLFDEGDGVQRYRQEQTFTIERVCRDLEGLGYSVQPILVPACAVGAPHRRDRVFIVANAHGCADGRATREDEGKGGAERIQERHEVRKPDEPNQVRPEGATIPQDSLHGGQLHRPNEEQGSEWNERHTCAGGGERICGETSRTVAADTACGREGTPRPSDCAEGGRGGQNQQPSEWGTTSEWSDRFYAILRNAADTANDRLQHGAEPRGEGCETGTIQGQRNRAERDVSTSTNGNRGTSTDTDSIGLHGGNGSNQEGHGRTADGFAEAHDGSPDDSVRREWETGQVCGSRWWNFPSVSPVHRGNDGLPFPLDDLAIPASKWRTESLKAYGNAIVPQVMYEIFRAIQMIENQLNKC